MISQSPTERSNFIPPLKRKSLKSFQEMLGHLGHNLGHKQRWADSDTDLSNFFIVYIRTQVQTRVRTRVQTLVPIYIRTGSDSDMGSDMNFGLGHRKFQDLGHGFGLGQQFGHGLRTRTWKTSKLGLGFGLGHDFGHACPPISVSRLLTCVNRNLSFHPENNLVIGLRPFRKFVAFLSLSRRDLSVVFVSLGILSQIIL